MRGTRPPLRDIDGFIDAHRQEHGVEPICTELSESGIKVAPSAYYARKKRSPSACSLSDARLDERLQALHADNLGVYGARKLWKAYSRAWPQEPVARCTIERRMRVLGLAGGPNARTVRATRPAPAQATPGDRLERDFTAPGPRIDAGSPTSPTCRRGPASCTSRSSWTCFPGELPDGEYRHPCEPTLPWTLSNTACGIDPERNRDLSQVIHHSDKGCQYVSIRYTDRLAEAGIEALFGSVGDSYDNAAAEALNKLYKKEVIWRRGPWSGLDAVELATLEWVDWYNNTRLHSYCGDIPPAEFEHAYYAERTTAPATASPAEPALH